jgi:hypothetical protein
LWSVLLGRYFDWDFRPMLQVDLALLALGSLALVLAARSVRGRSSLCDAFLPLLVLTSAHQQTLGNYVYAYAMALAVWCLTASAVMMKWPQRSVFHLFWYALGALVVAWSGGPAGNLWALGLCVPLILGCFERTGRFWKVCALVDCAVIAASSAILLYTVPPSPPAHLAYRSESWTMTLQAAGKFAVGWMGNAVLQVIWPWALLALAVPMLYLLVRFLGDFRRLRSGALVRWFDLAALLTTALLVTIAMGYGRARYPLIWESRYCALEVPIAVVLFLMLIRCAAPKALLNFFAIGMAMCVGWNWPASIDNARALRPRQVLLVGALRDGHDPLSVLAEQYPDATGWCREWGLQNILSWWQQMRLARISVFHKEAEPAQRCLFWHSESGSLAGSLHRQDDLGAVAGHAVQADTEAPSTANYEITVPASGTYKLCCRWQVPTAGRSFAVAVDDGPVMMQPVTAGPTYSACQLNPALPLEAGNHRLTITWPGAGSRLDILELTPR